MPTCHAYAYWSAMLSDSCLTHHLHVHTASDTHTSLMHTLASPLLHTLLCVLRSHSDIHAWPLTHADSSQDSHQFIFWLITCITTHNDSSPDLQLMLNSSYSLMCTHLFQILLCMILDSCWLTSGFIPIYLLTTMLSLELTIKDTSSTILFSSGWIAGLTSDDNDTELWAAFVVCPSLMLLSWTVLSRAWA